ncbi:MAG: flavodoxin family protein [Desulfarculus sp.]|jgi:multimeric flavodoxin WrbA|nr:MAG: flavodoxin family protein [Desulfarculus sp.]
MPKTPAKKQVLVLLGSPRKKGNSAALAAAIAEGAREAGARVEAIFLHGKKIAPCKSCYACQKRNSRRCAIDDDMQPIYAKLKRADAWVLASPVYWFNMSAQMKTLMDRLFALKAYQIDPRGKKAAIAMSFGDSDPFSSGCVNALRCFQDAFAYIGLPIAGMVYGSAGGAGEILANAELMQQARELGQRLLPPAQ